MDGRTDWLKLKLVLTDGKTYERLDGWTYELAVVEVSIDEQKDVRTVEWKDVRPGGS